MRVHLIIVRDHTPMEFCLHYYGELKSHDTAAGKHLIRQTLHPQIQSLCRSPPFSYYFSDDRNGERNRTRKPKTGDPEEVTVDDMLYLEPMYVELGSKRYWFLISEDLATVADLRITILLPHETGHIVHNGGDIDNRIKTLFDALRVPSAPSEIPSSDSFDYTNGGMYCLLRDDKLINRVAIQSYQDHDPKDPDSVKCLIEVETKITVALGTNLAFV